MALTLQTIQKQAKAQKLLVSGNTGNYKVYKAKKFITGFRTLKEIKQYLEENNNADSNTTNTATASGKSQHLQTIRKPEDASPCSTDSRTKPTNGIQELPSSCKVVSNNLDIESGYCDNNQQPAPSNDSTPVIDSQNQQQLTCEIFHIESNEQESTRAIEQIRTEIRTNIQQQQQSTEPLPATKQRGEINAQQLETKLTLAQQICTDAYVESVIDEIEELLNHINDGLDFDDTRAFVAAGDILIPARLNRHFKETSTKFYRFQDCDNYRLVAYVAFVDDEYQSVLFHDILTGYYFDDNGCYKTIIDYIIKLDINETEHQQVTDDNWLLLTA